MWKEWSGTGCTDGKRLNSARVLVGRREGAEWILASEQRQRDKESDIMHRNSENPPKASSASANLDLG